jgi:hypothetical protein
MRDPARTAWRDRDADSGAGAIARGADAVRARISATSIRTRWKRACRCAQAWVTLEQAQEKLGAMRLEADAAMMAPCTSRT